MFKTLPYRAQPSEPFEICRLQVICGSVADVAHSRLSYRERQRETPAENCLWRRPEKADTTRAMKWFVSLTEDFLMPT